GSKASQGSGGCPVPDHGVLAGGCLQGQGLGGLFKQGADLPAPGGSLGSLGAGLWAPQHGASSLCLYANFDLWGQGTPVTVSSVPETSPRLFPLSLRSGNSAGQVVIACLVQGFFPSAPPKVTWSQSGEGVSIRNFPPAQAEGLYTMSSQLTLPANQCPEGKSVKCQVQHLSKSIQTVDVPCQVPTVQCSCGKASLSLHPPALEDLLLGSNASLTCTLSGLRDPKGATFTWNPTGGKNAIQEPPKPDSCGCFSVSSVLPGCADPWKNRQSFSCTATHPESKGSLTATITKPSVNTFRPEVHLLPPPSEELALNEMVTLTCLVRGFSPKDVLVRWLQGNQELPREKYLTWRSLPEPNQSVPTFAVTSVLRVDAEAWKQGESFSCMVGHEALPLAFTQKTIDRLAGKPTHVNVSVVMSEVDGVCY
ncbi:Ig alpha-1 chain C region, partial [Tursiops truncatus]|uniref:Ig alpha-1 chain C region n=1 Tax=Tursiops truncatus TaxID=9739 RepID=UPI003CCF0E80